MEGGASASLDLLLGQEPCPSPDRTGARTWRGRTTLVWGSLSGPGRVPINPPPLGCYKRGRDNKMLNALREGARQSPATRPGGIPAEELGARPADTGRQKAPCPITSLWIWWTISSLPATATATSPRFRTPMDG